MAFDYVVVGSGLFGSVFAHEMTNHGARVLVVERRTHIGGNCWSEEVDGVICHRYGPHIFHTNSDRIWRYVNRLCDWQPYAYRPQVAYHGQLFSFPINLQTLEQLWGVRTSVEALAKLESVRVPIERPANLEEWCLSKIGEQLYQTFVYGYTRKQWGREPRLLPASIVQRLPIRLSANDAYFDDRHQALPVGGYAPLFHRLLERSTLELGADFFARRSYYEGLGKIVYTGPLDRFHDFKYGALEYRSLSFYSRTFDAPLQNRAVYNHTDFQVPYTRSIEHRHFHGTKTNRSVVTWEMPEGIGQGLDPYYPIPDERNSEIYRLYKMLPTPAIVGGRLGEYRYFNMDQAIGSALTAVRKECRTGATSSTAI